MIPMVRRLSKILNIISSETARPIEAKFYVEPPWEGGTKVYINGPGHMTTLSFEPMILSKLARIHCWEGGTS